MESVCQKEIRKLNALATITNYMELPKGRILMNAFFKAQFNYSPAIWMFHSHNLNSKIIRLHERCLRIIYNNRLSNFEGPLHKDNFVSIHHNNIHALTIEMYKFVNGMSPETANEVFKQRSNSHYNLKHTSHFFVNPKHSVYNGTEAASYLEPKIWMQIASEIQNTKSLEGFKREIKKWKQTDCPRRVCKIFIPNLGLI